MKTIASLFITLLLLTSCHSQPTDMMEEWKKMNAGKQETIEWFTNAKYGMFIHWGLYSIPAGVWKGKTMEEMRPPWVAEWIQYAAKIPRDEYAKLAKEFNPVLFDAEAIARLARDAGMKYLVITTKHHDGFAMYHSKVSPFNIVDATPFKRDVIKELYDACRKYGVDFGIYYSHNIDWADGGGDQYDIVKAANDAKGLETHPVGANQWDPSPNTFEEYLKNKAYPQVRELLTMMPGMKLLWYDMSRYMFPEQSFEFYRLATSLQPQILINERVGHDFGDFECPGDNKIPVDTEDIIKPWETVGTLNNSWGYKSYDDDWKSPKEVLYWLIEIVSKGGNYMLNIGPKATGEVPEKSITSLLEIGKWLAVNGEAIYNTSPWKINHEGPTKILMHGTTRRQLDGFTAEFTPEDFWFTSSENKVFAIALETPSGRQALVRSFKGMDSDRIESVRLLGADQTPEWKLTSDGLSVLIPKTLPSSIGYVLKITLRPAKS